MGTVRRPGPNPLSGCGLVVADASAVLALRPDLGRLARHLAAPHEWLATTGPDRAVADCAAAALWCAALWLGVGLVLAGAAALPGPAGRVAARAARGLLPVVVRRLVVGSTGLGVLLAPVAAAATPAAPMERAMPAHSALPSPGWPVDPPVRTAPARVTVRAGDSLWLIAQRRLGDHASPAATAAEWPRWYAANRAAIGPDPALIHPGQVLDAPDEGGAAP